MTQFLSKLLPLVAILGLFSGLFITSTPFVSAEDATCNVGVMSIKWWDIVKPGKFLPLVPADCAQETDGTVRALSPALLPDVFMRLYGFLVSLCFYLIAPIFLYAGLRYTWSGMFGSGEIEKARKLLKNAAVGLFTISTFYIFVMAVFGIVGFDSSTTSLSDFFSF